MHAIERPVSRGIGRRGSALGGRLSVTIFAAALVCAGGSESLRAQFGPNTLSHQFGQVWAGSRASGLASADQGGGGGSLTAGPSGPSQSGAPGVAAAGAAPTPQQKAEQAALQFRRLVVDPATTRAATRRVLRELDWTTTRYAAMRASQATGKPVFMVSALGDLKGYT